MQPEDATYELHSGSGDAYSVFLDYYRKNTNIIFGEYKEFELQKCLSRSSWHS